MLCALQSDTSAANFISTTPRSSKHPASRQSTQTKPDRPTRLTLLPPCLTSKAAAIAARPNGPSRSISLVTYSATVTPAKFSQAANSARMPLFPNPNCTLPRETSNVMTIWAILATLFTATTAPTAPPTPTTTKPSWAPTPSSSAPACWREVRISPLPWRFMGRIASHGSLSLRRLLRRCRLRRGLRCAWGGGWGG